MQELKSLLTPQTRMLYDQYAQTQYEKPLRTDKKKDVDEKFELIEEIGRGGMGVVFKARDKILNRDVALKFLPDEYAGNREIVDRFLKEARSVASLNHPNIVIVYEAGFYDNKVFISMEYIDGPTVKQLIEKSKMLADNIVIFISAQICRGLEYAHYKKIIHRDIKPSNVMLTKKKVAKIMDFGLAKAIEEIQKGYTVVGGTPYYMSPEQTLGGKVDHRTDIYSLGITIYEMVTGRVPFSGGDVGYHHIHTLPPKPSEFNRGINPLLESVIMKCLEKEPKNRFQSAKELFEALKKIKSY